MVCFIIITSTYLTKRPLGIWIPYECALILLVQLKDEPFPYEYIQTNCYSMEMGGIIWDKLLILITIVNSGIVLFFGLTLKLVEWNKKRYAKKIVKIRTKRDCMRNPDRGFRSPKSLISNFEYQREAIDKSSLSIEKLVSSSTNYLVAQQSTITILRTAKTRVLG